MKRRFSLLCLVAWLTACGGTQTPAPVAPGPQPEQAAQPGPGAAAPKMQPPASAARREVKFPQIARDTVELKALPVVQIKLVIRSGSATDPEKLPGLAQLTSSMLKEGTTRQSSAKLAEAIDFLGAQLSVGNDEDTVVIDMHALSEH